MSHVLRSFLRSPARDPRRMHSPTLVVLAGLLVVVVTGEIPAVDGGHGSAGVPEVVAGAPGVALPGAASAVSARLVTGGAPEHRGPRAGSPDGSGSSRSATAGGGPFHPSGGATPRLSPRATPDFAADALARAGRLAAPATAPPASPF